MNDNAKSAKFFIVIMAMIAGAALCYWIIKTSGVQGDKYASSSMNEILITKMKEHEKDMELATKDSVFFNAFKLNIESFKQMVDLLKRDSLRREIDSLGGSGKSNNPDSVSSKCLEKVLFDINENAIQIGILDNFSDEYTSGLYYIAVTKADKFQEEVSNKFHSLLGVRNRASYLGGQYQNYGSPYQNYTKEEAVIEYGKKIEGLKLFCVNFSKRADTEITRTNKWKEGINQKIKVMNEGQRDYAENYGNQTLIRIALPIFAAVVLVLVILPIFFSKESTQEYLFAKGVLSQIVTVFLLIVTILILGLGDILKGETLGTLLGGISVYMLQRTTKEDFQRSIDNAMENQRRLNEQSNPNATPNS